jgi:hypothetical protein
MSMDGKTLVIIEMTMTALLCLGFGFQQLWSLRRENRRAAEEKARAEAAKAREPVEELR